MKLRQRLALTGSLRGGSLMAGLLLFCTPLYATPLDDPLSLEAALALVDQHPAVTQAQADADLASANHAAAQAQDDVKLSLNGNLRWVDPSSAVADQSRADHSAALTLTTTLYDFGRTQASSAATDLAQQASATLLLDARTQHRITVMARFFDVVLADMQFSVDDESMAIAYVNFDKRKERFALGQISGLDLAKAEYVYQETLQRRLRSEQNQRISRARLANALNRPGELPSNLVTPTLAAWPTLAEVETLQQQAEQHNLRLQALAQQQQAAQQRIAAARAERRPILSASAEANYWDKDFGSRDKARAGIEISIPLYQGGRVSAKLAQAQAEFQQAQARLLSAQLDVRQAVLDTWMEITHLQAARKSVQSYSHWQDLQLDQSRTLYDLEFNTDLGESMIGQSEARLREAQNHYALALAWEKLAALIGKEK